MRAKPARTEEELFAALARLKDEHARLMFIRRRPELLNPEVVERLAGVVLQRLRVDIRQAMGMAEGALSIAEEIGDGVARARALRAKANVLYLMGHNQEAVALHEGAR